MPSFKKLLAAATLAATVFSAGAASASWTITRQVDKWGEPTGETVAHSAYTKPTRTPDFPYHDMRMYLTSFCDSAALGFSGPVNPDSWGYDSYGESKTNITFKIDGREVTTTGYHSMGSSLIFLDQLNPRAFQNASEVKVHVPHFGGAMVFDINMTASGTTIMAACS